MLFLSLLLGFRCGQQGEAKGGARARVRLDPDAPAVTLDNFLADGKSDARAGILGLGMEALKDYKNAVGLFWGDADAIIADRDAPVAAVALGMNLHARRLRAAKFDGVGNQ